MDLDDIDEPIKNLEGFSAEYETILEKLLYKFTNSRFFSSDFNIIKAYFIIVVVEYGFLKTIGHFIGNTHSLVVSPITIIIPIGILTGSFGLQYIWDSYVNMILKFYNKGYIENISQYSIKNVVPVNMQIILYSISIALYWWFLFFRFDIISLLIIYNNYIDTFIFLFFNSFLYIPLVIDFFISFITIQLIVSDNLISSSDFDIFFYDPRDFGGLKEFGGLLKKSYYFYTIALLLYLLLSYGPYIFPQIPAARRNPPGIVQAILFSSSWIIGTGVLLVSLYRLSDYIKRRKNIEMNRLERRIQKLINKPYNLEQLNIDNKREYEALQHNIEQVKRTSNYPMTVEMWVQIGISVLLPQVLEIILQVIL